MQAGKKLKKLLEQQRGALRLRHYAYSHESSLRKAIHRAAQNADLRKRVTPHGFRHSSATYLFAPGLLSWTPNIGPTQRLGDKDAQ